MSTVLVTHPACLELITIAKASSVEAVSRTPLSFPSRYQSTNLPKTSVSVSNGHCYLYSEGGSYVWEYDSRGRRVGEMSFISGGKKVQRVASLGRVDGKERVAVCMEAEIRLMDKSEGNKWACVDTLPTVKSKATALIAIIGGGLIAGFDNGDLITYKDGIRNDIPLNGVKPVPSTIALSPSLEATLVVPISPAGLLVVSLPIPDRPLAVRELQPFGPTSGGKVIDITFSPVTVTSDGTKRGGLCAVLCSGVKGDEVALVGLDTPESASRLVSFGRELTCLTFLDGATLAGASASTLYTKSLRALTEPPTENLLELPILKIQTLPALPRGTRSTSSKTIPTTGRTVLSDTRRSNETPVPLPIRSNGKETEQKSTRLVTAILEVGGKVVHKQAASARHKTVPSIESTLRGPVGRATSGPSSLRVLPPVPEVMIGPIESEDTPLAGLAEDLTEGSSGVDLVWALKPPVTRPAWTADEMTEIEVMRRDLANLHLEMLRMGRGLKNDIRKAVSPLKEELERSHGIIEDQKRVIDRLRRGF